MSYFHHLNALLPPLKWPTSTTALAAACSSFQKPGPPSLFHSNLCDAQIVHSILISALLCCVWVNIYSSVQVCILIVWCPVFLEPFCSMWVQKPRYWSVVTEIALNSHPYFATENIQAIYRSLIWLLLPWHKLLLLFNLSIAKASQLMYSLYCYKFWSRGIFKYVTYLFIWNLILCY